MWNKIAYSGVIAVVVALCIPGLYALGVYISHMWTGMFQHILG